LWTLAFYYELRSWLPEALDLMESTLRRLSSLDPENDPDARLLARLRLFQSWFLLRRARPKESQAVLEPLLPRLRDLGDQRDLAFAMVIGGHVRVDLDDIKGAIPVLEEGAAICRAAMLSARLQWLEAFLDARAAFYLAIRDGQVSDKARQLSDRALAISQQIDTPWVLTFTHITCSRLAMFQGEYAYAERMDRSALEAARRIGFLWGIGLALFYLGLDKYLQEQAEASWAYYEESRQFARRSGDWEIDAILFAELGELALFHGDY
jgi:ATP/maltotriose-dependent transcriptional regulator MalT